MPELSLSMLLIDLRARREGSGREALQASRPGRVRSVPIVSPAPCRQVPAHVGIPCSLGPAAARFFVGMASGGG